MGIDPVPVAPPAVGVRAEVRAKNPPPREQPVRAFPMAGGVGRDGVCRQKPAHPSGAYLADLDYDASFGAVVGAVVGNVTVVGERAIIQKILKLGFVTLVAASNRIEFHVVELNHIHDVFLKRVECVNNIWGSKRTSASLLV